MNKKIVAVCENEKCKKSLEKACTKLGYELIAEIQEMGSIKYEISEVEIQESSIVIFAIDGAVESIEKIERFIDYEYYEVEPKFIINDSEAVINEIILDLN